MVDRQLNKAQLYDLIINYLEQTRPESLNEFFNTIDNTSTSEHIPTSIFIKQLTPLESITKYLKENLGLTLREISKKLNRNEKNIWHTNNNAQKKHQAQLTVSNESYLIPLNIFENSNLSVPESIIMYLKDTEQMSNKQIAELISRNERTIWTMYYRAKKKLIK